MQWKGANVKMQAVAEKSCRHDVSGFSLRDPFGVFQRPFQGCFVTSIWVINPGHGWNKLVDCHLLDKQSFCGTGFGLV